MGLARHRSAVQSDARPDGIAADAEASGYQNDRLRALFEEVTENTRVVLKDFTYDMRREKHDIRSNKELFCDGCGMVKLKCTCDESEDD